MTFNVSLATAHNCCCNGMRSGCDFILYVYANGEWDNYEYDTSCVGNFWNVSVIIGGVTANSSFCAVINPQNDQHPPFMKEFNVSVQGTVYIVHNP